MAEPFGYAPMLNFNSSIEAIKELQGKGALTKRMLIVATAKALAENIPIDIAINICKTGPASFVQIARQPLKTVGLGVTDQDLREIFGQICWLTSRRADREGVAPPPTGAVVHQ